MTDIRDAVQAVREVLEQREPKWKIIQAVLGNGDGSTVDVPGRDGPYDYIRLHGQANEVAVAWNTKTASVYDLPVDVRVLHRGKTALAYEVLGVAPGVWTGTTDDPYLPMHGETHEYGPDEGYDPVHVYQAALVPLRVEPRATPGMTVRVRHGWYYLSSWNYYAGGISPTFTAPADSGTQRSDLLYLNSDGLLRILEGSVTATGGGIESTPADPLPATIPLASILLTDTTTTITSTEITDVRMFVNPVTGSTTGNGGGSAVGLALVEHEYDHLTSIIEMILNRALHRAIAYLEHEIDSELSEVERRLNRTLLFTLAAMEHEWDQLMTTHMGGM